MQSTERAVYADLFQRYTQNTDGKHKIAESVLRSQPLTARQRFLDLGAGDGILTRLLAAHFEETVAVERNAKFLSALDHIERCSTVHGTIENVEERGRYDLILLSYSLTGIEAARLPETLHRMHSWLTPRGRLVACTFDDSCDWARFAYSVSDMMQSPLRGGSAHYESLVRDAHMDCCQVSQVETKIWDDDLPRLTDLMGFFFMNAREKYTRSIQQVQEMLKQHAKHSSNHTYIRVLENIYSLHPNN